jgi:hypothetical protein
MGPRKNLVKYLPMGVQKSYFLLPKSEREILNTALQQYQSDQHDPNRIGGTALLKTALQLMSAHRLELLEKVALRVEALIFSIVAQEIPSAKPIESL